MNRTRATTALTVGHVTHDRFGGSLRAGGSAYYGARTFDALGARSRLMTVVGDDFRAHEELLPLEVFLGKADRTTTFENRYPADKPREQWIEAVAPPVTADLVPPEWRRADILFLAPVCGEIDVAAWLSAVDARVVGLGLQGLLKCPGAGPDGEARRVVPRVLPLDESGFQRLGVVFLSDEDLAHLAPDGLLSALRDLVPVVVLTRGDSGSSIFSSDREERIGVYPTRARDPTGAGDTFAATFLFAHACGAAPPEAGHLAAAAASIVVEAEGGAALSRIGECFERSRHF